MRLIIGLGNPGLRYTRNRHNAGFMCINYFARQHGIPWDKKQGKARVGMGEVSGVKVMVARPQTYMNSSGESVSLLVKRYKVELNDLIIIHDDLDLPLGKIRIRHDGGSGGHKGMKSIVASLGSPDFIRLRVGIGRPTDAESNRSEAEIIDYVLSDFTPGEKRVISEIMPRVSDALTCLLSEGLTVAMNKFNYQK